MPDTVLQRLVSPVTSVFRRLSMKRRLDNSSGDYESSWLDISEDVKRWGKISWSLDQKQYSYFQQGNVSFSLVNDRGQYEGIAGYWTGYLSRYKTLVKVEAGFLDPSTGAEIPGGTTEASTSTQFMGVITEPIKLSSGNEASMNIKALSSIFEDIPANLLAVASAGAANSGQLTSSDLLTRMRDATDGASTFIFRKFITSTLWDIEATTQTLTALDTTTALDSYNCWTLAKKLAESSNKAIWISKLGGVNFKSQTPPTDVSFIFSGAPYYNTTYGHTIKKVDTSEEDITYLYNRIRVKFNEADTSTSWTTKQETWQVGDSTTSWKYGVKTLEIKSSWLNTTTAINLASTLYADFNRVTDNVELRCKYIPTLKLLDRCRVNLIVESEGGTFWDFFNWDEANWDNSLSPVYGFRNKDYKIIKLEHDLQNMETMVGLRSIPLV